MKQLNYWIWLHDCLPQRSNVEKYFRFYSCPQEIYEDSPEARAATGLFHPNVQQRMKKHTVEESYRQIEVCAREGIDILTPEDKDYPPLLLQTPEYPALLFAKGNLNCLKQRVPLAIVGTRQPSQRSRHAASELAFQLSECNFLICSGGALGIDSAAHMGALQANAPTVAVLGAGFLSDYLSSQQDLRQVIAQKGLLLSELNPWENPNRGTFPNRNRIIAGMTVGTLVIEAHKKSGSLLTARDAYSYGREVMAIPGDSLGSAYAGAEELLSDGATRVTCSMDLIAPLLDVYRDGLVLPKEKLPFLLKDVTLEENWSPLPQLTPQDIKDAALAQRVQEQRKIEIHKKTLTDPVTKDAERVYACFEGVPLSIDALSEQTGLTISRVLGSLTELELLGYLRLQSDRNYILKQDG